MIFDSNDILEDMILASASPRRQELLRSLGLDVRVVPSDYAEPPMPELTPAQLSLNHAQAKAREVAARFPAQLVIGADTVVDVDGEALGKPSDAAAACAMLRRLSGREHFVHTSIAVVLGEQLRTHTETTRVRFFRLEDPTIEWYVAGGDPLDKAGAYGIQGSGALFVERIEGDFYSVMGFPLARFARLLEDLGISLRSRNFGKPSSGRS